MHPTHHVEIRLKDGAEVSGKVMYLVVWEGKALSGGEVLVRGDEVKDMWTEKVAP
jgi:small nuclear ribonucleoprotein (snRNP)-like protein